MTILIISTEFVPESGGLGRYSYEIAKNLHEMGQHVFVLAPKIKKGREFDKGEDFKIYRPYGSNIRYLKALPFLFCAWALVRRYNIKYILATSWNYAGTISLLLYKLFKIPYFIMGFGLEIVKFRYREGFSSLMNLCFSKAKAIFACSEFTKGEILEMGIPSQKIVVIYGGVDLEKFNLNVDYHTILDKYHLHDKKVILTIGRLVARKRHNMVLKALSKVIEKIPKIIYLIVGDGPERNKLRRLVRTLNLDEHVVFVGDLPYEATPPYYRSCDVFIMPSYIIKEKGDVEGFGLVYLEANACGKPVIGGRGGGTTDAIIDGETGLLIDSSKEEEISNALTKLLKDEKLAKRMGEKGRKRVIESLNWQRMTRLILNTIISTR